jgi:hypothetical protein
MDRNALYRERREQCLALAAEDRKRGDHRALKSHLEGAAMWERLAAESAAHACSLEAEGYVPFESGCDFIRLYRNGEVLSPDETRAVMSADGFAMEAAR